MSVLIDKLRQALRPGQTLGFGAGARPKPAGLVLVAELPRWEATLVAEIVAAGADAVLISKDQQAPPQELRQTLGHLPWGVRLEGKDDTPLDPSLEGCDFLLFSQEAPASLLGTEGMGKILLLDRDAPLEEGWLRATSELPVDALFPRFHGGQQGRLTVLDLLLYRRLSTTSKPILAGLPSGASLTELGLLRDTGVLGLVVVGEGLASRLTLLREAVHRLPPPSPSHERKAALLPFAQPYFAPEESEEAP